METKRVQKVLILTSLSALLLLSGCQTTFPKMPLGKLTTGHMELGLDACKPKVMQIPASKEIYIPPTTAGICIRY